MMCACVFMTLCLCMVALICEGVRERMCMRLLVYYKTAGQVCIPGWSGI